MDFEKQIFIFILGISWQHKIHCVFARKMEKKKAEWARGEVVNIQQKFFQKFFSFFCFLDILKE